MNPAVGFVGALVIADGVPNQLVRFNDKRSVEFASLTCVLNMPRTYGIPSLCENF